MHPARGWLSACTVTGAPGIGRTPWLSALAEGRSALEPNRFSRAPLDTWIGRVPALDDMALPDALQDWDCRATRLAWTALQADGFARAVHEARRRHGDARVGLVLGTSASTIAVSEAAYRELQADGGFPQARRRPALNTLHGLTRFVQLALGLQGPAMTVSTACSSGAKALASAGRWLTAGVVDAVVVAGVDALCESVLWGFHALQLTAPEACRPLDAQRCGISVAEGAAFVLLTRDDPAAQVALRGWGESNDAHHLSAPHPQGLGAERALEAALAHAGVAVEAIDHVNLHATATPQNDAVEAAVAARRYAAHTSFSATKGLHGHTMGAAGLVEVVVCALAIEHALHAGVPGCEQSDTALAHRLSPRPLQGPPIRVAASHSFGFGGNNAVVIVGGRP